MLSTVYLCSYSRRPNRTHGRDGEKAVVQPEGTFLSVITTRVPGCFMSSIASGALVRKRTHHDSIFCIAGNLSSTPVVVFKSKDASIVYRQILEWIPRTCSKRPKPAIPLEPCPCWDILWSIYLVRELCVVFIFALSRCLPRLVPKGLR